MDNKEPENPVVYLSKIVKKLDVKNRNGLVALAIVNLLVILLFKFYLKGSGLLSWICLLLVLLSIFKKCRNYGLIIIYFFLDIHLYNFDSSNETVIFSCQINI